MKAPSLHRPKDRRMLGKRTQLVRELTVLWNREIPQHAAQAIPWSVLRSLVDSLSQRLDTRLLAKLNDCIEKRSVSGYIALGAEFGSPQMHADHASYFASISVLNLFKKFPWTDGDLDPANKARSRFDEAERLCHATNRRFTRHRLTDFAFQPLAKRLDVHQVFHLARRKIADWLGPCEPSRILSRVKHGPGGCVGLSRPFTTPYFKFAVGNYTVSEGAYFHAMRSVLANDAWARALWEDEFGSNADKPFDSVWPGWQLISDTFVGPLSPQQLTFQSLLRQRLFEQTLKALDNRVEITDYNKVSFVPKDASTLRAIATEPELNVLLQLVVGDFFKEKLRYAGCDLKSQLRNQDLAWIGSIQQDEFDPVTIDLRMASDCLAIELVMELLPYEWAMFLCSLRSRNGRLDGKVFKWEKFSSMGNGFTFELESMIFYALAQSVSDIKGTTKWFADTFGPAYKYAYVSVFGDDIIVPKNVSEHLVAVLRFCGFQTNHEKTFTCGPFRESCGKDYYDGVLVRPFYLTRALSQVKDLIHLRNNLKGLVYDGLYELRETVALVDSFIPQSLIRELVGPRRLTGDGYIWSDPDACHQSKLVVWDTDYQAWLIPKVRQGCVLYDGPAKVRFVYLQFLYANARGEPDDEHHRSYVSNDAFWDHKSSGGSSSDVVLSGTRAPGVIAWETV